MNKKGAIKSRKKLILATTSPHRIKAFETLDIPFDFEGSDVEEYFEGRPDGPEKLVMCLAKLKAEAVAKNHKENCIIIGFDSVGCFEGKILEKPKSKADAFRRLKALSGNKYEFYTGIHLIDNYLEGGQTAYYLAIKTEVLMRELETSEINHYLMQDPNFKTYAIGHSTFGNYGATFAKEIHGSYNNLLYGLPLEAVIEIIRVVWS